MGGTWRPQRSDVRARSAWYCLPEHTLLKDFFFLYLVLDLHVGSLNDLGGEKKNFIVEDT